MPTPISHGFVVLSNTLRYLPAHNAHEIHAWYSPVVFGADFDGGPPGPTGVNARRTARTPSPRRRRRRDMMCARTRARSPSLNSAKPSAECRHPASHQPTGLRPAHTGVSINPRRSREDVSGTPNAPSYACQACQAASEAAVRLRLACGSPAWVKAKL